MKVKLLAYTPDPEKVVACAAKLCYSKCGIDDLMDNMSDEKAAQFIENLNDLGHQSPIEHANFTFAIEDVSRSLLAQITRHRIASFSVQSQRYVDSSNFEYVTPPSILGEDAEELSDAYQEFQDITNTLRFAYSDLRDTLIHINYQKLILSGTADAEARKQAEKMANEDARFILPNACATKMVMTMNARSLNNFFELRCCNRAQWEIRDLATEMLRLVKDVAPHLFANSGPACVRGACHEGKMCCGKQEEMKNKFRKDEKMT